VSGLVVRPGDTLVWSIAPPSNMGAATRVEMQRLMEEDLPGVKVVIVEGMAGGPFVYRPDPSTASRKLSTVDNPVTGEPLGYVKDET
jgi:hypothetical protein